MSILKKDYSLFWKGADKINTLGTIPANFTLTTINPQAPAALSTFTNVLAGLLREKENSGKPVILCIGSDRSTGDALGPLVGSMLEELKPRHATVLGTLAKPVHALNIKETRAFIAGNHDSAAILAIDAGLGQQHKVGFLEVGRGSLKPGAAVKKRIPPVGDIFITGIVNVGGFMELMVLQSTRLGIVLPLARFISWGL